MTADLPAGWTTRRPTLDDVPAILAVVHASDIAAVGRARLHHRGGRGDPPGAQPRPDGTRGSPSTPPARSSAGRTSTTRRPASATTSTCTSTRSAARRPRRTCSTWCWPGSRERAAERGGPRSRSRAGAIPRDALHRAAARGRLRLRQAVRPDAAHADRRRAAAGAAGGHHDPPGAPRATTPRCGRSTGSSTPRSGTRPTTSRRLRQLPRAPGRPARHRLGRMVHRRGRRRPGGASCSRRTGRRSRTRAG